MKIFRLRTSFLFAFCLLFFALSACQQAKPNLSGERVRDFANVLYNRDLFKPAIAEYERYLQNYPLDEREQANISYTIGNIYFDRLRDYEAALAYYLRVKELYPKSELVDDASKRVVECLERLQRSADAQQALEESTMIDPAQMAEKRPGEVIAKIGDREITTGDLEFEMKNLPPFLQAQIKDRNKKIEFLKQFVASELLYNTAKRKGLENDKEVLAAAFQAKKNIIVQRFLQEEISRNVQVDPGNLELYYRANLQRYARADSGDRAPALEEVRSQVTQDYLREKQQETYNQLVERMMRAEAVVIYEDKVQ